MIANIVGLKHDSVCIFYVELDWSDVFDYNESLSGEIFDMKLVFANARLVLVITRIWWDNSYVIIEGFFNDSLH